MRFFKISGRPILFVSGMVGLYLFFSYWSEVTVTDHSEILMNQKDALARACHFLQASGATPRDYQRESSYQTDEVGRWYFKEKFGVDSTRILNQQYQLLQDHWYFQFRRPVVNWQTEDWYRISLSLAGALRSWRQNIPQRLAAPVISTDSALAMARNYVRKYKLADSIATNARITSQVGAYRTDFAIEWSQPEPRFQGNWRYQIDIQANKLSGFTKQLVLPTTVTDRFAMDLQMREKFRQGGLILLMLCGIWLLIEWSQILSAGSVPPRNRILVFLISWGLLSANTLNAFFGARQDVITAGWFTSNSPLIHIFQSVFVENVLLGILVYLTYQFCEDRFRINARADKLQSLEALFNRQWLNLQVAQSMSRGLLSAATLLGLLTLGGMLINHASSGFLMQAASTRASTQYFPWLAPLFQSASTSLITGVILIGGVTTLMKKYLKSNVLAALPVVLLQVIIGFPGITFYPFYSEILVTLLLASAGIWIFNHFDFLTLLVTLFVMGGLIFALPLLATNNAFLIVSGMSATIVSLTPFFNAYLGYRSRQVFQSKPVGLPTPIRQMVDQELQLREWDLARRIQLAALPTYIPPLPNLDLSGICVPTRNSGGNFFNFIPTNSQKLVFVMGAFPVRGIQAALNITTLRALIQALVMQNDAPKHLLLRLNALLAATLPQGQQVCLFCGVLDSMAQTFTYTQAGDSPGIWFQGTTGPRQSLENPTPVEMLPHPDLANQIAETQIQLRPGDTLYFFNRGILRLQNSAGRTLSENDLLQFILAHLSLGARGLLTQVAAGIQTFTASPVPTEDVTMAVVKVVAHPLENKIA